MSIDDADLIARLEGETRQLRQILDDERRHVAVLRETVRQLRDELACLRAADEGLTRSKVERPTIKRLPGA